MNKRIFLTLAGISLLLTICLTSLTSGSARALGVDPAPNAYDMIAAVNGLRASRGLPNYNVNSILMQIAQKQADYLASTGGASGHTGPGGTRPIDRAIAAGYPVSGGLFSENWLAGNYTSASGAVYSSAWADAAHQTTMLSPTLADIGAGVATSGGLVFFVIDCGLATNSQINTPSAGGGTVIVVSGTAMTQDNRISVAIVSTPDANGNIYHTVQFGQTLWQIALAYKTTINSIKQKNNLTSNDIYIGEKLLIGLADTPTPAPPTDTPTLIASPTLTPSPTLEVLTETPSTTATLVATAPASSPAGGVAVVAIIAVALFAAGLVAWAGRSRPI